MESYHFDLDNILKRLATQNGRRQDGDVTRKKRKMYRSDALHFCVYAASPSLVGNLYLHESHTYIKNIRAKMKSSLKALNNFSSFL